ncbi:MAG: DUF2141 domain-containing protein [Zymomonas mobilis]|uniref:Uncharacterized protein DUF2141 n=1 Tax=Zymomonas mobilis TaxID=542 RepID=A0A542VZC9_ZYMMB|nr:DUF2141 domain-containing protein [Zymomonas mobilis]TQL16681.1 uncharacterized protein DUF2141 [Zymomonas mobilis]
MLEFLALLAAQPVVDGRISTQQKEASAVTQILSSSSVSDTATDSNPKPIMDSANPDSSPFSAVATAPTKTATALPSTVNTAKTTQKNSYQHMVEVDSTKGLVSFMANDQGIIANAPSEEEVMCRPNEKGPALVVQAVGLKDRKGLLRIDLYPPTEDDFMADEEELSAQNKIFRRQEMVIPKSGPIKICVRVPKTGVYAVILTHDRDANHRVTVSDDGVGIPINPPHLMHEPRVQESLVTIGAGVTTIPVRFNYRRGLLSFAPLQRKDTIDFKGI